MSEKDVTKEQAHLFQQLMNELYKEEEELEEQYNIARNLACSEWSKDILGRLVPNKMCSERMDLLEKNFNTLRDEISRKRYYAIVIFWKPRMKSGILLTENQVDCLQYWETQLHLLKKESK